MSCYHPLRAFNVSKSCEKAEIVFDEGEARRHGILRPLSLPCGRCIGCRLDYSRDWANRCMMELQYHDSSYFLTLTYDDVYLPTSSIVDLSTGEALAPSATLDPRDMQLFIKRLRKNTGQSIRYYLCGEYGGVSFRPHYHAIVFGLVLDDLELYMTSPLGHAYYNSPTLVKCWPKGYVVAAQVTWEACAYTARYILKKQYGPDAHEHYAALGVVPEFTRMSLKPAIGKQYYLDHPDLFDYDWINVSTPTGGKKFAPPRYFRKLLAQDNPQLERSLAKRRMSSAINQFSMKKHLTDVDEHDILIIEEEMRKQSLRGLPRNLVI